MGGFVFQYGTAAHLAILTVAPLFLLPLCAPAMHAQILAWLSALAVVWVVMNPSLREGEWPRDARRRIGWEIAHDPFLFFSIVALVLAVVRAINGGISLDYNASSGMWFLKDAFVPTLPGSVTGRGVLPLAGILSLAVVTLGVRHALGARGRFAYLLVCGVLAALAVLFWKFLAGRGFPVPQLKPSALDPFPLGSLLGVYFLFALGALVMSWRMKGSLVELVSAFTAGVLLFGLLSFAPTFTLLVFAAVGLAIVGLGVGLLFWRRPLIAWCRSLIAFLIVLSPIAFLLVGDFARPALWPLFSEGFLALRDTATSVALEAWKSSPRIGLGLGAYPLSFGFFASAEDWKVLSFGQTAAPDGWVHFLFERGILGAAVFLGGLGLLLRDGILRYVRAGSGWSLRVTHLLGPLVLLAVTAVLFVECAYVQIVALVPVGAVLALTAAEFPESSEMNYG